MSDTADSDVETTDTSVENAADNGEASAESTDLALKDLSTDKEAEQSEAPVLATGGDEGEAEITRTATDLEAVYDIPVQVSAVLGKADMEVSQLLKLGRGAVIELDRKVGCPSSKQMGLLSVFHKGGSGSSLFDVKPLGFDGSSGGFGWSVF